MAGALRVDVCFRVLIARSAVLPASGAAGEWGLRRWRGSAAWVGGVCHRWERGKVCRRRPLLQVAGKRQWREKPRFERLSAPAPLARKATVPWLSRWASRWHHTNPENLRLTSARWSQPAWRRYASIHAISASVTNADAFRNRSIHAQEVCCTKLFWMDSAVQTRPPSGETKDQVQLS